MTSSSSSSSLGEGDKKLLKQTGQTGQTEQTERTGLPEFKQIQEKKETSNQVEKRGTRFPILPEPELADLPIEKGFLNVIPIRQDRG